MAKMELGIPALEGLGNNEASSMDGVLRMKAAREEIDLRNRELEFRQNQAAVAQSQEAKLMAHRENQLKAENLRIQGDNLRTTSNILQNLNPGGKMFRFFQGQLMEQAGAPEGFEVSVPDEVFQEKLRHVHKVMAECDRRMQKKGADMQGCRMEVEAARQDFLESVGGLDVNMKQRETLLDQYNRASDVYDEKDIIDVREQSMGRREKLRQRYIRKTRAKNLQLSKKREIAKERRMAQADVREEVMSVLKGSAEFEEMGVEERLKMLDDLVAKRTPASAPAQGGGKKTERKTERKAERKEVKGFIKSNEDLLRRVANEEEGAARELLDAIEQAGIKLVTSDPDNPNMLAINKAIESYINK